MPSAASVKETRRRAAPAPSIVLWSTFSVAWNVVLVARVPSAPTNGRGTARPTVSRLVCPSGNHAGEMVDAHRAEI